MNTRALKYCAAGLIGVILIFQAFLALKFYLERMASFDASYYTFMLFESHDFAVVHNRLGAILSQVPTYLLLDSSLPISSLLKIFSVSFILIYALIAGILWWIKDWRSLIVLACTISLGFHYVFYYATTELYPALAFAVLVFALWKKDPEGNRAAFLRNVFFAAVVVLLCSYYNPLVLFALLFAAGYLFITQPRRWQFHAVWFVATLAWFWLKMNVIDYSEYEQNKIPATDAMFSAVSNWSEMKSLKHWALNYHKLPALIVGFFVTLSALLIARKWILAGYVFISSVGFLSIIWIGQANGESHLMYEAYLPVLGFFFGIPLAQLITENERASAGARTTLAASVVVVLILAQIQIYRGHISLTEKVNITHATAKFVSQRGYSRGIIHTYNLQWPRHWLTWALPFESYLISAARDNEPVTLVTFDYVPQIDSTWFSKSFIGAPFWYDQYETSSFSKPLINLPEGQYLDLNTPVTAFDIADSAQFSLQVPETLTLEASYEIDFAIPLSIENHSMNLLRTVPTDQEELALMSRVWNLDKSKQVTDQRHCRIFADIPAGETINQYAFVNMPKHPGDYLVEVVLWSPYLGDIQVSNVSAVHIP